MKRTTSRLKGPLLFAAALLLTLIVLPSRSVPAASSCVSDPNRAGETFYVEPPLDPNAPRSGIEDGTPAHPFRSIQTAIDNAGIRNFLIASDPSADPNLYVTVIQVLPGVYREKVKLTPGLCLQGSGRDVTTIDGAGGSPVVEISTGTTSTVLDGFTITGGVGVLGGGVLAQGSPVISNNTITGNLVRASKVLARGAGIVVSGNATLKGNLITGNTAIGGSGAGIAIASGSPLITRNVIQGNTALASAGVYFGYGGGIAVERAAQAPLITNNIIVGNRAEAGGGGVDVYRSNPIIAHNVMRGNGTRGVGGRPGNGGGLNIVGRRISEEETSPSVVNNVLVGNWAGGHGGGISVFRAHPVFAGNDLADNTPEEYAGQRNPAGLDGNFTSDPGLDPNDAPLPSSPLIDAGSDGLLLVEPGPSGDPNGADRLFRRRVLLPAEDIMGTVRPLDSSHSGHASYDIGIYEAHISSDPNDLDDDGVSSDTDGDPNTSAPCVPDPNGFFSNCDDDCPRAWNPSQEDTDHDGVGDACDNCLAVPNGPCDPNLPATIPFCDIDRDGQISDLELKFSRQRDSDQILIGSALYRVGDGIGDACDLDRDNDGILEDGDGSGVAGDNPCRSGKYAECDDNCPDLSNTTQRDRDHDGVGDACDNCTKPPNGDCSIDPSHCYTDPNGAPVPSQQDSDDDGIGDACDNCPDVPNGLCSYAFAYCDMNRDGTTTSAEASLGNQVDLDHDKIGDACDPDRDGDRISEHDPNNPLPPCAGGSTLDCSDDCGSRYNPHQEDPDGDGVGDHCDNCSESRNGPCDPNEPSTLPLCDVDEDGTTTPYEESVGNQIDTDRDRKGDACDTDDDNDGVPDDFDNDPNTSNPCYPDPNGIFSDCDDNCRTVFNSAQEDMDHDHKGDACDDDIDGDLIPQDADPNDPLPSPCAGGNMSNCDDNCPLKASGDCGADPLRCDIDHDGTADPNEILLGYQLDSDGDLIGDVCDNCPTVPNSLQTDSDADGIGDACETDIDGDGVPEYDPNNPLPPCEPDPDPNHIYSNCSDNCPGVGNATQADADGDRAGDACDNCDDVRNGDCAADPLWCDIDGDGVAEPSEILLGDQVDYDFDRRGDACDEDFDGDGVPEDGDQDGTPGDDPCFRPGQIHCDDNCPRTPNPTQKDLDRDGIGDACDPDRDGDGVPESDPNNPLPPCEPDPNGVFADCSDNCPDIPNPSQADQDADGVGDVCDPCPADGSGSLADQDQDGIGDGCDNCPGSYNPAQADGDGDGTGNACEETAFSLRLTPLGETAEILKPGKGARFEIAFDNPNQAGERFDVTITFRDPGGKIARQRTTALDAYASGVTRVRSGVMIPGHGSPGSWTITAEACPQVTVLPLPPGRTAACPNGGDSLKAGIAVSVK